MTYNDLWGQTSFYDKTCNDRVFFVRYRRTYVIKKNKSVPKSVDNIFEIGRITI